MFGKIYETLYEGSMVGSGATVFAVWGYVIAKMKPDREVGAQVDLNPQLLGFILGEPEGAVQGAIEKLCAPDPKSRTPDEDGRRLVRVGQFSYRVVNAVFYMNLRSEEDRKRQNREAQARFRQKKKAQKPGGSGTVTVTGPPESEAPEREPTAEEVEAGENQALIDRAREAAREKRLPPNPFPKKPKVEQGPPEEAFEEIP